jgi:hypothetical protein
VRAPDACAVQGLHPNPKLASPAAPLDSMLNSRRLGSHARWLLRFRTVDDTAACARVWLCAVEGVCDSQHFGGSLGALAIAPPGFGDFVYGCIW